MKELCCGGSHNSVWARRLVDFSVAIYIGIWQWQPTFWSSSKLLGHFREKYQIHHSWENQTRWSISPGLLEWPRFAWSGDSQNPRNSTVLSVLSKDMASRPPKSWIFTKKLYESSRYILLCAHTTRRFIIAFYPEILSCMCSYYSQILVSQNHQRNSAHHQNIGLC